MPVSRTSVKRHGAHAGAHRHLLRGPGAWPPGAGKRTAGGGGTEFGRWPTGDALLQRQRPAAVRGGARRLPGAVPDALQTLASPFFLGRTTWDVVLYLCMCLLDRDMHPILGMNPCGGIKLNCC